MKTTSWWGILQKHNQNHNASCSILWEDIGISAHFVRIWSLDRLVLWVDFISGWTWSLDLLCLWGYLVSGCAWCLGVLGLWVCLVSGCAWSLDLLCLWVCLASGGTWSLGVLGVWVCLVSGCAWTCRSIASCCSYWWVSRREHISQTIKVYLQYICW